MKFILMVTPSRRASKGVQICKCQRHAQCRYFVENVYYYSETNTDNIRFDSASRQQSVTPGSILIESNECKILKLY